MRRLILSTLFVLLLLCLRPPVFAKGDSAKAAYAKGTDAEARQNYEQAFDYFKQAYNLKPKDLRYRTAYERTRFLAASSHVHRGQILRDAGKLDEALAEFQKGLEIDPSSFIAQQELKRTQQMIREAQNPQPQAVAPTGLRRRLEAAQGPVELAAISNVPITLKVTEKSNVIYETVGKLAGINVLFDPDYTAAPGARRTEQRDPGRSAGDHFVRDQNLLASGDAEHDFCCARQSRKAERAGTKRHQDFLSFQSFSAYRIAGHRERHAHHP